MSDWMYEATYAQAKLETLQMQLDIATSNKLNVYYNLDEVSNVSAIVIAENVDAAIEVLTNKLLKQGLTYRGTLTKLDTTVPNAVILQAFDY